VKASLANKDIADPMFPTYMMLLGMATLWGGTFIAGRLIGTSVDPYSAAFLRFAIASVCLSVASDPVQRAAHPPA
jgi:drug/metabolite transporter (DMT)-like permease